MGDLPYECALCGRSHAYNAQCERRTGERRVKVTHMSKMMRNRRIADRRQNDTT